MRSSLHPVAKFDEGQHCPERRQPKANHSQEQHLSSSSRSKLPIIRHMNRRSLPTRIRALYRRSARRGPRRIFNQRALAHRGDIARSKV
jgi:hypothetical protein